MLEQISFRAKIWKYHGKAAWHFVTLPKSVSKKIRKSHGNSEEGWGRLKAQAQIGNTKWDSAIWYDTKAQSYLLPIKSEIRKKEKIITDAYLSITLIFAAKMKKENPKYGRSKPTMWS